MEEGRRRVLCAKRNFASSARAHSPGECFRLKRLDNWSLNRSECGVGRIRSASLRYTLTLSTSAPRSLADAALAREEVLGHLARDAPVALAGASHLGELLARLPRELGGLLQLRRALQPDPAGGLRARDARRVAPRHRAVARHGVGAHAPRHRACARAWARACACRA
eukprot:scaffold91154_cov32-Phaeocystis_antarctica.AAC.1